MSPFVTVAATLSQFRYVFFFLIGYVRGMLFPQWLVDSVSAIDLADSLGM